jgi:hypothetical protein
MKKHNSHILTQIGIFERHRQQAMLPLKKLRSCFCVSAVGRRTIHCGKLAASGGNGPHRVHFQRRWFPAGMGLGRDGDLHVLAE